MLPYGEHGLRRITRGPCRFTPTGPFPPRPPDRLRRTCLGRLPVLAVLQQVPRDVDPVPLYDGQGHHDRRHPDEHLVLPYGKTGPDCRRGHPDLLPAGAERDADPLQGVAKTRVEHHLRVFELDIRHNLLRALLRPGDQCPRTDSRGSGPILLLRRRHRRRSPSAAG